MKDQLQANSLNCNEETEGVSVDSYVDNLVDEAVTNAIFANNSIARREFITKMGAGTAMALISSVLPLGEIKAWAKESSGPIEKPDANIAYLPIVCATPLVACDAQGYFKKNGLTGARLHKEGGWNSATSNLRIGEADATQMLAPMPLAYELGLGPKKYLEPYYMGSMINMGGSAITLNNKYKNIESVKDFKGLKFGIPWKWSIHNLILRYYVAAHGLNPDTDIKTEIVAPTSMLTYLKNGLVDGFIVAEPYNQAAVQQGIGFIHKLTTEIFPTHPCCGMVITEKFAKQNPNTYRAIIRSVAEASAYCNSASGRDTMANVLSQEKYLNQPAEVLSAILKGQYDDGLGGKKDVGKRIDFEPFPWQASAVWILAQMKRWGYLDQSADYRTIATNVFRSADCAEEMKAIGLNPPATGWKKVSVMGQEFDPYTGEIITEATG